MATYVTRDGYEFTLKTAMSIFKWTATKFLQAIGLANNAEWLRQIAVHGLKDVSPNWCTAADSQRDGWTIYESVNYYKGGGDPDNVVTILNPASKVNTNLSTPDGDPSLFHRNIYIIGTVNLVGTEAQGSDSMPTGAHPFWLNTGWSIVAWPPTITANYADMTIMASFYTNEGQADDTGDDRAFIEYAKPGGGTQEAYFYLDSGDNKLKMSFTGEDGCAWRLLIAVSPRQRVIS